MDSSTTRATQVALLPDLSTFVQSWTGASTQAGDASTAFVRQALTAGMQWLETGASNAGQWLTAVSGNAHRLAEAAHDASAKAERAGDVGVLWNAELELASNAAQMTGASLQDLWAAMVEQQSQLMKSVLVRNNETLQTLYQSMGGNGAAMVPAASEATGNGFGDWFDWMNQATRAVFDAAAGATAAAQQAVANVSAETSRVEATPARRGKDAGRRATR